jgi:hypothetical protein
VNEERKKAIREQKPVGSFYFPSHPDGLFSESVVFFYWLCTILKSRTNRFHSFAPKRKLAELSSPHREALASKLGYSLSRVGLPTDKEFR